MNNDQFRKLAFGSGAPSGSKNGASSSNSSSATSSAPRALGSRQKASIPMTPRYGSDVSRMAFARQLAERYNNDGDGDDKKKSKVRTSKPKGSKFAAGYVDRAKMRSEQDAEDSDRAARLTALEELYKKGEVEQAVYEKLRFEIAGGDLSSTHLVKGLDFKLLNRVRMGEDVFDKEGKNDEKVEEDEKDEPAAPGPDVDDEFEKIEGSEVQAIEREKAKKKGQYSTTAAAGQKRSRDQILAEMKAAREAAKQAKAAAAEPVLGSRFKKIGAPQAAGSRIEIDSRGREVLVIVDEDGHEKRKVRKMAAAIADNNDAPKPEGKILGMEVPEFYRKKQEAEAAAAAAKEVDIFEDAGSDYDPLAGMDSGSSDESESDEDNGKEMKGTKKEDNEKDTNSRDAKRRRRSSTASSREDGGASDASRSSHDDRRPRRSPRDERKPSATTTTAPSKPRNNYFGGSTLLSEETSRGGPSLNDPSVLAALRKAKQMREATESEAKNQALSKEAEREARLKKLMQSSDRDAEDLDMGFGTNRLEDTEDLNEDREGGRKERLSTWRGGANGKGDDDEDGEGGSRGDKAKRKRGGKKRKGDGNNAEDVMRVLEKRREGTS